MSFATNRHNSKEASKKEGVEETNLVPFVLQLALGRF